MQYFVHARDGGRYGPADINLLNQWIQQGRLTPTDTLEDAQTGQRLLASQVPGLFFGHEAPPTQFQMPPSYQTGGFGQDYGAKELAVAWWCLALALVCGCFPASIVGIFYAAKAKEKGNPKAVSAITWNALALLLTICMGLLSFSLIGTMNRFGSQPDINTPYGL